MGQLLNSISTLFAWIMIYFYNMVHSWGISIILMTILLRLLLFPTSVSQVRSMEGMKRIQPLLKEIQNKYKDKPQEYQQKVMETYKKHGVNPIMGGCLPMLLQFPILIALYNLLRNPAKIFANLTFNKSLMKGLIHKFETEVFMGMKLTDANVLTNMNVKGMQHVEASHVLPFLILVFLSGATTFILQKISSPSNASGSDPDQSMQNTFLYIMQAFFTYITYTLPAGLGIYWVVSNILTIIQQITIVRYFIPKSSNPNQPPK